MRIIDLVKASIKIDWTLHNESDTAFFNVAPISEAQNGSITWVRPTVRNATSLINLSHASCIICDETTAGLCSPSRPDIMFVATQRPDIAFLQLLKFLRPQKSTGALVHSTAIVNAGAVLGKNVVIGPFCIIGEVEIGDDTIIDNNVRIHDGVSIGRRCRIREFCSIGGSGFGFVELENGFEHMPHLGKVVIEDDVQIFPFSNVDRATLSTTRVSKGVKIDHHCHVGHNSFIGADTIVTAKSVLCGGAIVGAHCFLGVGTVVNNNLRVGDGVTTGIGSIITKDIPANEIWFGNPARKWKDK